MTFSLTPEQAEPHLRVARHSLDRLKTVPALADRYAGHDKLLTLDEVAALPPLVKDDLNVALAHLQPRADVGATWLFQSGGSTGAPKVGHAPTGFYMDGVWDHWKALDRDDVFVNAWGAGRMWGAHFLAAAYADLAGCQVIALGSVTKDEYGDWLSFFDSRKVTAIGGTPSVLRLWFAHARAAGIRLPHLRKVLWLGEAWQAALDEDLAEVAPQAQRWGMLGSTETWVAGTNTPDCPADVFHTLPEQLVHVEDEILDFTTLNPTMLNPVLRYQTGDAGEFVTCTCGRTDRALRVLGRRDSVVQVRGLGLHVDDIIAQVEREPGVAQAQILITERSGRASGVVIQLLTDQDAPPDLADRLRKDIMSSTFTISTGFQHDPESFQVRRVDSLIFNPRTGKTANFVVREEIVKLPASLGRQYNLFWSGQTISTVGDRITIFVVPTVMIFALHASAFSVGVVAMAQYLGIPVLGPIAGVLVDRWNKRVTMLACDIIRLVAVLVIPLAYWRHFLSVPLLFACVALISGATIFFNVGYLIAVPATVSEPDLVRAYSRLEGSGSVSEVAGPSIAAGLYSALGVGALFVDAASYLVSAACFRFMRPWGEVTVRSEGSVWARLTVGFRLNWADPVLRRVVLAAVTLNCGGPIFVTVLPILAYRGLGLKVGVFGIAMSVAAVGALIGALVAPRISAALGVGRTFAFALLAHNLVGLGVLAAPALPPAAVIAVTMAGYGFFMSCINVCSAPTRQSRMSAQNQGVMHAAFRTFTWGVIPLAALVGGLSVTLLTGPLGILDAARVTMVGGTLLAALSFLPALGIQSRLDLPKPGATTEPETQAGPESELAETTS